MLVAVTKTIMQACTQSFSFVRRLKSGHCAVLLAFRKVVFSFSLLTAATTSGSRAHRTVLCPIRAACAASAVPQAPPPETQERQCGCAD